MIGRNALAGALLFRSRDVPRTAERLDDLEGLVRALPPAIDREAVYRILCLGVILRDEAEALDPAWTSDRDDAYRTAKRALRKLRKVLARRDLDHRAAGLERELEDLMAGGEPRLNLLRHGSDRADLSPTRRGGGRPLALWRAHTLDLLRDQNVTADDAGALLAAAGLADRTPKPR